MLPSKVRLESLNASRSTERECLTHRKKCQLKYLLFRQELRLVHQHAVDWTTLCRCTDGRKQIGFRVKEVRLRRKPIRERSDLRHIGGRASAEKQRSHATLTVIVIRLQERRALSSVHGGIIEVQLCHR